MKNFKPNENFTYFLYFISERMNIFWNKLENKQPYTEDEILKQFKFTNVYRMLDRSSQYLIKNVIYNGVVYSKEEMFWRIMVYKHFNLPSTWDLLIEEFGDINKGITLDMIADFLVKKIDQGYTIYSNAYMMTSAFLSGDKGKYTHLKHNKWRKHQYYFYIFQKELIEQNKIGLILNSKSIEEMFSSISSVVSMGDFTAYQYTQDLNYTEFFNFDMNTFCAAGPGTQRGIERCFDIEGAANYGEIVKWTYSHLEELFAGYSKKYEIDLQFRSLPNFSPQVPDLSNCFCETDKYLRGAGITTVGKEVHGKRIKNTFKESSSKIDFVFPPKFGISL